MPNGYQKRLDTSALRPFVVRPTEAVAAHIEMRLGGGVSAEVPGLLHKLTQGNALFMVQLLEYMVEQGLISHQAGGWIVQEGLSTDEVALPHELKRLLIKQIEALPPLDQHILEVASVAGEVADVAAVAAGMEVFAYVDLMPADELEAAGAQRLFTHMDQLAGWLAEVNV